MIKNAIFYFQLILISFLLGCQSVEKPYAPKSLPTTDDSSSRAKIPSQPIAATEEDDVILDKNFFMINYDSENRIAKYVEYNIKAENLKNSVVNRKSRRDPFHPDSTLWSFKIPPVEYKDYTKTGYDRGHLAPSGDFEWSEEANLATFTMANMVPQKPDLNRTAWRGLETDVRGWACAEDEVKVITGPIIQPGAKKLDAGITIPQKFFKIVLDLTPPVKAIGFVLDQSDSDFHVYKKRVESISNIEILSGISFFRNLTHDEKSALIANANLADWHTEDCKSKDEAIPTAWRFGQDNSSLCDVGILKAATIRGCCAHHGGVKGPKNHRACCEDDDKVICNDGSKSQSCRCEN